MKEQLEALYALQAFDLRIHQINASIAAMGGGKQAQAQLQAAKAAAEAVAKDLSKIESELKDSELTLKSIDEKRTNYEKKLYGGSVTNSKELASLEKEVAMLKKQQSELDEKTLSLYEKVSVAREKAKSAEDMATSLEERIEKALRKQSDEKVKLQSELDDLIPKRDAAAKQITDKTLLARYDSLRRKCGAAGIAKVIEGQCEGCKISVTPFTMRALITNKEYQLCESCGRILMLEL